MKSFKVLGLLVLAMAMTAFAGSASAEDYVTTTTGGKPQTSEFHLVNEGGHIVLQNGLSNISCASTASGHIESSGGAAFSHFTFTGCTNSWHVTVENVNGAYGAFWIDHTSGHDGTVTSMWVRINATRFGIECVYETFLTHIGTLTGGDPATLHFEASIPIDESASSFLCGGGSSKWEGNYVTTSGLYVGRS